MKKELRAKLNSNWANRAKLNWKEEIQEMIETAVFRSQEDVVVTGRTKDITSGS